MKRMIVFLTLATSWLVACNTGNKTIKINNLQSANTASYTSVQWLDSIVNFGTIARGEKIAIRFRFRNTGSKPLFLTNVHAGCGCTVPDYTKDAIAPGKEGLVTGAFDSNRSAPGEVRKTIIVNTNTTNGTTHTLIFTGLIK
ncbi:MAG: hypothetical protein NVSMB63_06210 [Sediminibacterium sp.]